MLASDDPAHLTPEQRFDEIAQILAGGLLHSKTSAEMATDLAGLAAAGQNSPKSAAAGLEVSEETVLSVLCG